MSDEPKKDEQVPEVKTELSGESLPESELEKVSGGGKQVAGGRESRQEFSITKFLDASTP
jgi:hypothetical protein